MSIKTEFESVRNNHVKFIIGNFTLSVAWTVNHYCDNREMFPYNSVNVRNDGEHSENNNAKSPNAEVFLMCNKEGVSTHKIDVWGWVTPIQVCRMVIDLQTCQEFDEMDIKEGNIMPISDWEDELAKMHERLSRIIENDWRVEGISKFGYLSWAKETNQDI